MVTPVTDGLESFWEALPNRVNRLQTPIEKAVLVAVGTAGFLTELFSMLEPCEVKVSRTVLRGALFNDIRY